MGKGGGGRGGGGGWYGGWDQGWDQGYYDGGYGAGYWTGGGGGGGGYHTHGNQSHKGRRGGKGGAQAGAKADTDSNWRGADEGKENGSHHNAQSSSRNGAQQTAHQSDQQANPLTANFACQDIRYMPDAQQSSQQHGQAKAKAQHRGGRQRGKGGRGKGGQHTTDDGDYEGNDDFEVGNTEYGGSAASNQGASRSPGFALPPPGTHTVATAHVGSAAPTTQPTSGLMPLPPLGPIDPSPSAGSPTAEDDWDQMDSSSPFDMGNGFSGLQQMVYSTPEQTQAALAALQAVQAAALQPVNPNAKINQALNAKIRKSLLKYEETLDIEELGGAYAAFDATTSAGEGCCDASTLTLLLVNLTRVNKLANAHKVLDAAVADKVFLEPVNIIAIATAVSQRSQSHKALRYLRRLIYECLGDDFGQEQTIFFDRHVSFIFSELMAEADGCFARMENRDPHVLVHLGHAELDVQMDWKKSTGTSMVLFNRGDDKGKKVYIPTVLGQGFQRTDSCLMSFDISNPEVQKSVGLDYDRIRDGAEVEVYLSSTGPTNQAPLSVRLTSPAKVPLRENMFYRLDRLASRDQTRRMLDSLKVILRNPQESSLNPYSVVVDPLSTLQPNQSLRELLLVPIDTTLSKVGKAHLADLEMDFTNDKAKAAALKSFREEAKHALSHLLNKSQIEALLYSCSRRLTLIQGPPGTGKTTTAVQVVTALVQYGLVDLPMLVTADSNTAVDNLVKGIAKRGLNVVRVGRPEAIREDVKQYALDGRWKELKKAEVVCATCIGASGTTLDKIRFATVLIDECTQAAESAALVPMARGCQQVILLGDQCQLPPTVLSDVAETENLGESLFTRLVTQGVRPVLLDTQYRMHPLIAEFASAAFYNGRLQNGVSHIHRKPPEGFPWPQRQMPVAFVNLERGEEKREGSSYVNVLEAEKTLWALQEVCKNDVLGPEDVGIVTPYKGQVNFLKKLIRERIGLTRFRSGLEVESVDGFQGQEKEVIIFCAVRNNREGKVGFLSDWRRLNVMLTRARRGCIVIGSKSTLVNDPLWQQWLLWASARGAICGESAKGTWVPRYLVDDRDGVWTIKSSITDEAKTSMSASALVNASKPPDQQEVVVDSWEDMGSPQLTPAAPQSRSPLALDLDDALQSDAEDPSSQPEVKTRAQELREERLQQDDEVIERLKDLQVGSPNFARNTSGTPPLRPTAIGETGDDEMRTSRSPLLGPRSPQRQLALARLGLLDDAEAEELSR